MSNFDSGVKEYITGRCEIEIHFPVDFKGNAEINCYQCKMFSRNTGICQLTKEVSEYPTKFVGSSCPLILVDKKQNEGEIQNEKN